MYNVKARQPTHLFIITRVKLPDICTGGRAKVREFESKRNSDFRPRLHISFIRRHQNSSDTTANCSMFEPFRFYYFRVVARRRQMSIVAHHAGDGNAMLSTVLLTNTLLCAPTATQPKLNAGNSTYWVQVGLVEPRIGHLSAQTNWFYLHPNLDLGAKELTSTNVYVHFSKHF